VDSCKKERYESKKSKEEETNEAKKEVKKRKR
jgi:hypothetical protein